MTIGDGIMASLFTKDYVKQWRFGPVFLRNMSNFFLDHLVLTKIIGVLETGAGLWIGSKIRSKNIISKFFGPVL